MEAKDDKNMRIWDALCITDPAQTKGFKRAGGFTGTAIKPMWVWKRLTDKFGPVGEGWGFQKPTFQVVPGANKEVLVFCDVTAWYFENRAKKEVQGVGGDKVVTYIKANEQYNRPERWESDDEAFKKAFTDALMNAFKFVGVAADVHMGLFDDNKYVSKAAEHFKDDPKEPAPAKKAPANEKVTPLYPTAASQKDKYATLEKAFDAAITEGDLKAVATEWADTIQTWRETWRDLSRERFALCLAKLRDQPVDAILSRIEEMYERAVSMEEIIEAA